MELVFRQGLGFSKAVLCLPSMSASQSSCGGPVCRRPMPTGSSTAWNMGSNRMSRCPVTTHQWRGQLLIPDFTAFLEKVRLETMYPHAVFVGLETIVIGDQ